jgi:hypothetical protein
MSRIPTLYVIPILAALLSVPASAPSAAAASGETTLVPYHQLAPEPPTLALTPGVRGSEFRSLLDRLEAAGVRLRVAIPGAGIVLVAAPGVEEILRKESAIERVLREPSGGDLLRTAAGSTLAGLLQWWNEGFEVPVESPLPRGTLEQNEAFCAGAVTLERALELRGLPRGCTEPTGTERVHFAAGRVVVSLILPQGPYVLGGEQWGPDDISSVLSEKVRALNWWNLKSGGAVHFVLVDRGVIPTFCCPEDIPAGDEELYIRDCMNELGFAGTCGYEQLEQYNIATKEEYGGHWVYTQFVLPADTFIGMGNALAYAYLGGPLTVALLGNGTLGTRYLDRVIAHEMGHIFQALDEYASSQCSCGQTAGYLSFPNLNCENCTSIPEKCVMRGSGCYTLEEMDQMERFVNPCYYTKGQVGIMDRDGNGILDVMETFPETEISTEVADTLMSSQNVLVEGRAWDQPYDKAPARYQPARTINTIQRVEFSVDGHPWEYARPTDGWWGSQEEEFQLYLPELGGGAHRVHVRGVNSVWNFDPSYGQLEFFVYDVKLRDELEVVRARNYLVAKWQVDGRDFGSVYRLYRQCDGGSESLFQEIDSQGGLHDRFKIWDETVQAGHEYTYRLEVDIPGKGVKALGIAKQSTVLAPPAEGSFVSAAPNPFRENILLSVTVPKGPPPDTEMPDLPPEDGSLPPPPLGSSGAGLRGGDDGSGSGGEKLYWRDIHLAIYDVRGRLVRDLGITRQRELSTFNRSWSGIRADGRPAPAGVYFLKIEVGEDTVASQKIILLR